MEHTEHKEVEVTPTPQEATPSPAKQTSGTHIGIAIVIAGAIIAGAIYFSGRDTASSGGKEKTIIQTLGINENKFKACFEEKRYESKVRDSIDSANKAMAHIPSDQGRGTPYSIIMKKDGTKVEIAGAYPIEAVKGVIDSMLAGKLTSQNEIDVDPVTPADHHFGSDNAEITIIEYSDLECPYCARFHQTMHQIVTDYNGKINWVYRHLPLEQLHPNAFNKALASECVAELGGNDKFWDYIDDIFQKAAPKTPTFDPLTGETV